MVLSIFQDEGNFTQSTAVKVTIEDANDQSIEFVYPGCSVTCSGVNVSFSAETNESYVVRFTTSI